VTEHKGHITAGVRSWVSRHTFTAVPAEHKWADDRLFHVTVEQHGPNMWTVWHIGLMLDYNGTRWVHSSDNLHGRFDLETALQHAERWAPKVSVNGRTAGDLQ
jgi:hypothetical protein